MTRSTLTATKLLILTALCAGFFGYASAAAAFTCTAVAGGGNWSSAATWSGCNSTFPQTGDDVILNSSSGNVVLDVLTNNIQSLDMTGYTGTFSATNLWQINVGPTSGSGDVKLGGTITWAGTLLLFPSAGATTTLTTNGKTLQGLLQVGNGSSQGVVVFADAVNLPSTKSVTFSSGFLHTDGPNDNSGLTHSWGAFNGFNSNIRTLNLGKSSINITSGNWDTSVANRLTVIPGNSTITLAGASATFNGGGLTYYNVTMTGNGNPNINSGGTYNTVIFTGGGGGVSGITTTTLTVTGTNIKTAQFLLTGNPTINGTLTLNGNNTVNRLFVSSNILGTTRTITVAGNVSASNVDFQDLIAAGAANWNLSGISGGSGDALGNSGITFTASTTNYWVGDTGNWSDVTHWANITGGTGGTGRIPLPQDDVRFDANSFSTTGKTVTADMPRMGANIDWTGVGSKNPILTVNSNGTQYGSLTLSSGMTTSNIGNVGWNFNCRSSCTITNNGASISNSVGINTVGGIIKFGSDYVGIRTVTFNNGTLDANGYNVTIPALSSSNSNVRTLKMGSGTWTINGTTNIWSLGGSNLTFNAGTSNLIFSDTGSSFKAFGGGNFAYNNFTVAGGGTGTVSISGNNSFNTLTLNGPKTVLFGAGNTQTISNFVFNTSAANRLTIQSTTNGTRSTLSTTGVIRANYLSVQDSIASGGARWFAGDNSINLGNNLGWQFNGPRFGVVIKNSKIKIQNGKVKFQFQ